MVLVVVDAGGVSLGRNWANLRVMLPGPEPMSSMLLSGRRWGIRWAALWYAVRRLRSSRNASV